MMETSSFPMFPMSSTELWCLIGACYDILLNAIFWVIYFFLTNRRCVISLVVTLKCCAANDVHKTTAVFTIVCNKVVVGESQSLILKGVFLIKLVLHV